MEEKRDYYPFYQRLMKMPPRTAIEQTAEYRILARRDSYLSESIRISKELDRLREKLKFTSEPAARREIHSEIRRLSGEMRRQGIMKQIHGGSKWEASYKRRFILSSVLEKVKTKLKELSWESRLPPSLVDLRSLDSVDRSLALRQWIKRRRKRMRRRLPIKPKTDVGAKPSRP